MGQNIINQLLLRLLQQHQLDHQVYTAPDSISLTEDWIHRTSPEHTLTSIAALKDRTGIVIAVFPENQSIQLDKLNKTLRRRLEFIPADRFEAFLSAFQPENGPSKINDQTTKIIIDEASSSQDLLCLELPQQRVLQTTPEAIEQIPCTVLIGSSFSSLEQPESNEADAFSSLYVRNQIKDITSLPAMPDTARKLLAIRNSSNSTLQQINRCISQDPALAALIIRYANSAMFGMKGKINDLNDAIFRVLGFDGTLHLALGLALGKPFKLEEQGQLSRMNFWQRSVYTASLAQKLALEIPKKYRPQPGLAYLAGLLHDIGYLLLADQFEPTYKQLNKLATANSTVAISALEQLFLGVHHAELGQMLLQNWNLPNEVIIATRFHHDPNYTGLYNEYANLILLADRLLKSHDLAYADNDEIPHDLCVRLKLDEEQIYAVMDEVIQGDETLRGMASKLSA
ncbi:MAG: HDOD domain-containing protein [Gammaproteobacteria bacterium]|nr:HDOD domain-containing protein [Gammaproteobacteria bacterium]MDH5778074.1 HDOD domain-containing protein [Gammaproteobacteria bacterium]